MPFYEYQCKNCKHQLEVLQKMSDPALTECPECHRPELAKLVSKTSFQLKGQGWYVTDYKDKDKKKPEPTSATTPTIATTASQEKKVETTASTESKPAASTQSVKETKE